jgi:hypothetical protein
MRLYTTIVSGAVSVALLCAAGLATAAGPSDDAEQLRRMDIMLMVTSLRCRKGPDNFQSDYNKFSAAHLQTMNAASRQLKSGMEKQFGMKGAARKLDQMSVSMANDYGNGHPWLECAELREVTRELASEKDPGRLVLAADELLARRPTGQLARLARR